MRRRNRREKIVSGRHIFAVLIAVFALVGGYAAYRLIMTEVDYTAADNIYGQLRLMAPAAANAPGSGTGSGTGGSTAGTAGNSNGQTNNPEGMPDLTEINPDYIGWIRVDGTDIDYPVVQGTDNTKYLKTTFTGEQNPAGTIFMDADCTNQFDFFAIIHGHNMRNGSMFAGLHQFRDTEFRTDYSEISIFTPNGDVLVYKIFAVKLTNINDGAFVLPLKSLDEKAAYLADFGFTAEDLRDKMDILILATCTEGNKNERLLILSGRVR